MKRTLLLTIALLVGIAVQAQVTTFPWMEGFENGLGQWTLIDQDGDGYNWNAYSSGARTGSYCLMSASYDYESLTPDNYAFSPAIALPDDDGFVLEYWVANYSSSYPEYLSVYIVGENTVAAVTAATAAESYEVGSTTYTKHTVNLNDYAGQTVYIVFRHHNSYDEWMFYIDDVTVRQTGVPMITLSGPANTQTGTDATFVVSLTEGQTPTYTWTSAMADAGLATITGGGDTAIVNYSAGGTDTVTVVATNAFGSATAFRTVTVVDCGSAAELPWTADLSSNTAVQCWNFVNAGSSSNNWSRSAGNGNPYLSSRGNNTWAVTPLIQMPASAEGAILEYNVRGYNNNTYEVWVSPDGGANVSDFTDSLFGETYTANSYAARTVDLSAYGGQQIRIAFRHTHQGSSNNAMRLRGIGIRLTDAPVVSLSGAATTNVNIAETYTATLTEGATTGLTWSWTSTMEAAGNATMVEADSTMTITYTAAGRDTITVVATNAFGSDSKTTYVTVIDLNPVGTFPYTTGFENSNTDNINWQLVSSSSSNAWAIGSATSNGDSNALYISNNGGTTYGYNNSSQTHAYAYRVFNLEAGEYNFAYDWRCVGEQSSYGSIYDYMRVFLAPATFEPSGSTTGLDYSSTPAGFMALDGGVALVSQSTWTTAMQTVTITTPGLYKMVFYWRDDSSDSYGDPAAIDNVSVSSNSCPKPTGLTATVVTANTITLGWTAGGDETEWIVTADGIDHQATTNSYTVTGLDANTIYTVGVRAFCSEGDTSLATSLTVRTECDGGNCSFTINMIDGYGDGWNGNAGINIAQGGATVATATFPSTGSYSDFALSADFSICAGQPISLSWNAGSYDYECSFTVVLADGTVAFSVDSCSTLTPGEVFLTFDASCNVEGEEPGPGPGPGPQPQPDTCYVPTNLHLVGATSSALTLDWTPAGSESQWQLQVDAGQPVNVSSHPYTLSGLTASTTYSVKVRALCGSDNYSDWSAAVSVATAAGEEPGPGPGPGDGIADVFAASVVLSPNPASSTVSISADGLRSVELIDMSGRVQGEWNAANGEIKLDVGQMARGVYFVRLHADGFTATRKLIVSTK